MRLGGGCGYKSNFIIIQQSQREIRDTQWRGPGETEAEIGVMQPQSPECQQLPEAGGGKGQNLPQNI